MRRLLPLLTLLLGVLLLAAEPASAAVAAQAENRASGSVTDPGHRISTETRLSAEAIRKNAALADDFASDSPVAARGIGRSLDNLSSLRGASVRDVEALADAKYLQQGWTKKPLSNGDGIRYFDGKGNSFQINQGYPGGGGMHGGAYVKTTQGNQIVRIPLEGNPGL